MASRFYSWEYSALVASSALDFEDTVALVAKRGCLYGRQHLQALEMVAVLNTPVEVIEESL